MAGEPPVVVRFEIDGRPLGDVWSDPAAADWRRIDVSNACREIEIDRGARSSFGEIEPAEGSFRFDNSNGFLDPLNMASPYAGLLTPGRQIRVVQVRNSDGADQVVFRGAVKSWPPRWAAGAFDVESIVEVRDLKWYFGAAKLPESLVLHELLRGVRYSRPAHVFVLRENETSAEVDVVDDIGRFAALPVGSPEAASGGLLPFTDVKGLKGGNISSKGYLQLPTTIAPPPPWTYAFVGRTVEGKGGLGFSDQNPLSPNLQIAMLQGSGTVPRAYAAVRGTDGAVKVATGGPALDDNAPHLVSAIDDGGALYVYSDAVYHAGIAHGAIQEPRGGVFIGVGTSAQFALCIIWDRVMTSFANLWADISAPWANQWTRERVPALIGVVYPGLPVAVTAGHTVTCLPVRFASLPLLDVLERTVAGADGRLWIPRVGGVMYADFSLGEPPAAIRTYGVGAVPVTDFDIDDTGESIVTQCAVSTEAGVKAVYENRAASDRHGQRRITIDGVSLRNLHDAWARAEREVHFRSALQPYVQSIELMPVADGVGFDDTLALDIYDRIDHVRQAPAGGPNVTDRLDIVGLRHWASGAGFADWTTTLRTRPVRRQRRRMNVPGATGGAQTPDSPANSFTGSFDIRARFWRNDWYAAGFRSVIAKDDLGVAGGRSWTLTFNGVLMEFAWWKADNTLGQVVRSRIPRNSPIPIWIRALRRAAAGELLLQTSEDGETWDTLAAATGGVANALMRDSPSPITVGYRLNVNPVDPLVGRVLYAEIRNAENGPVVNRFDPQQAPNTAAAVWVADTGEQWNVNAGSQPLEPW